MSIQAVAWVLDHSQSRGFARLVLISLANHHNAGTGQCDPGQRRIAQEAGISPGSVSAQIAKLVELGEVSVTDAGGSHRSASYRLNFAQEVSVLPAVRADLPVSTRGNRQSTRGPEPRRTIEPTQEPEKETLHELSLVDARRDLIGDGVAADERSAGQILFDFEVWWQDYPRRVDKADARRAYARARKHGATREQLVIARDHYCEAQVREGTETRYYKHAATLLNQDRWREWLTPPPTQPRGRRNAQDDGMETREGVTGRIQ